MEPSNLTVINQFCRRSIQEALHILHIQILEREKLDREAQRPASPNSCERKKLETIDLIENVASRISDAAGSIEDLCCDCAAIDIVSHLKRQQCVQTKLELSLGPLLEVFAKTGCAFCSFVREIVRAQYAPFIDESFWQHCCINGSMVECVLEELFVPSNPSPASKSDLLQFGFFIKLELNPYLSKLHHDTRVVLNATFHTLANPTDANEKLYQARKIPNQIDLHLAGRWLSICEIRHPYLPYRIPGLRVIDLVKNCLVIPDVPVRYMTLSYTWGKAQSLTLKKTNSEDLHLLGGLGVHTDRLPRTIKDAMTLTKGINERFLWVDALCITQDDPLEQQTQIMRMDQIYQNSILTLVACHGLDADSGLPGVHLDTRFPVQRTAEVRGQRLISHDVEKWWRDKHNSVWSTRGWTYQEHLCSNRLLIVGKSQLHFECTGNCVFCEEMAAEVDLMKPSSLVVLSPRTTNYFPRAIWNTLTNSFCAYETVVSQYSRRAITNPHDILNAVAGILNRWQQHYGHRGTICGLPAGMMDAALLWRCKGSYRRRLDPQTRRSIGYSSWSWVAWEGEIDFPHSGIPYDALLSMVTWDVDTERYDENLTQWRKVLAPENPAMADGPSENWKRIVTIQPIMESLSINYVDTALPPNQANFAYPSRRNVEAATLYGTTRLDGTLRFRARCGIFALTTEDVLAPPNTTVPPRDAGTLTVLDKDGCVAGAVEVPPPWVDTVTNEPQEFVVLSRTTLTQLPTDPSWDETTQTFLQGESKDRRQVMHQGKQSKLLRDQLNGLEEIRTYNAFWKLFDRQKYSALKFWPLYNVLLVRRQGDYAYRLGLGQIHVDALDPIAGEKLILLS